MARYYRRKRRFGRRRFYRRRYRKTYRRYKKRTIISKARRYLRRSKRVNKKNIGYTALNVESKSSRIICTQQSNIIDATRTSFTTLTGHTAWVWSIDDIMPIDQLNYIKNNYWSWQLLGMTYSIKLLNSRNLFVKVDNGSTLANFYQGQAQDETNIIQLFSAFFTYQTQYTTCVATDPDTSTTTLSSLMETNKYKKISLKGKANNGIWYNTRSYIGTHNDVGLTVGTTTLDTAFAGSMPLSSLPYGADIMIVNRDCIQTNTGAGEWKFRFQIVTNSTISVRNKKPLDY